MSSKLKNIQHKKSLIRKKEAESILSEVGLSLKDDIQTVGVVLEHIGLSQLSLFAIDSIAYSSKRYAGLDINIFVQKTMPSIGTIACPVFSVRDMVSWSNCLITTSISTTLDALRSQASCIIHYAFNLDFIHKNNRSFKKIEETFCDSRITVITRSKAYKEIIEKEFDIQISELILSDFDMVQMTKLLLGRKKNGCTITNV